jgi:hypothetical protein
MSSQVNPNAIDAQFPVPGLNQPSQGFRTNFLATQNAFAQYVLEMNDVINKAIVSSPLLFGANSSINNFGGMQNSNLALFDFALVTASIPALSENSVPTLSFAVASVANINITSGTPVTQTINLVDFPSLGYSEMVIQAQATTVPQFLNLANLIPSGSLSTSSNIGIAGYNSATGNFAITSTNPYTLKFSSTDGLNYVLSSASSAVAKKYTPASSTGAIGDTAGMVAYDSNYLYVAVGNYDGTTHIWQRSALATF